MLPLALSFVYSGLHNMEWSLEPSKLGGSVSDSDLKISMTTINMTNYRDVLFTKIAWKLVEPNCQKPILPRAIENRQSVMVFLWNHSCFQDFQHFHYFPFMLTSMNRCMSKSWEPMILLLVVSQTVEARIGGFHALNAAGQGVICGDAVVVVLASDGPRWLSGAAHEDMGCD